MDPLFRQVLEARPACLNTGKGTLCVGGGFEAEVRQVTTEERRRSIFLLALAVALPFLLVNPILKVGQSVSPQPYDYDFICIVLTLLIGATPLWFSRSPSGPRWAVSVSYMLLISAPLFVFVFATSPDPFVVSTIKKDVPWFVRETGIKFPAGTVVEYLRAEESFVGSGGEFRLTVRFPAEDLPAFMQQEAFRKSGSPQARSDEASGSDGFRRIDLLGQNGQSTELLMKIGSEEASAQVAFDYLF